MYETLFIKAEYKRLIIAKFNYHFEFTKFKHVAHLSNPLIHTHYCNLCRTVAPFRFHKDCIVGGIGHLRVFASAWHFNNCGYRHILVLYWNALKTGLPPGFAVPTRTEWQPLFHSSWISPSVTPHLISIIYQFQVSYGQGTWYGHSWPLAKATISAGKAVIARKVGEI